MTIFWFLQTAPDYRQLGLSALSVIAFSSNMLFWHEAGYFDAPSLEKPLLHTWSLAVEEQFYLVFPLALWALAMWTRRSKYSLPASRLIGITGLANSPNSDCFGDISQVLQAGQSRSSD